MQVRLDFGSIIKDQQINGTFHVALESQLILPDRIIPAGVFKSAEIADGSGAIDLEPTQAHSIFYTGFLLSEKKRVWSGRFLVPAAGTNLRLSQLFSLSPSQPPTPPPSSAPTALMSFEYVAPEVLSALRVVRVLNGNQLEYASSDNPVHAYGVLGILPFAVNAGESIAVITEGAITDSSWNWDTEQPIFLGVKGQLTQTAPTTGFLLQVATAIVPTQIQFEIQEATLL